MSENFSLKELLPKIKPDNHYLSIPSANYDSYIEDLNKIINKLKAVTTEYKAKELIDKKLQFNTKKFNEAQFIQTACELTSMNELLSRNDISFNYEEQVTPPQDIDFSIKIKNRKINVEVKCPSYQPENKEDITLKSVGRIKDRVALDNTIKKISDIIEGSGKKICIEKSMDNKLKDYLKSAQRKLKNSNESDTNILIVCCDNAIDMMRWFLYLHGSQGLFTENSFVDRIEYNRVDYVLLTNIFHRHNKYFDNTIITDHWKLSKSFNLLYPNKLSSRNIEHKDCNGDLDFVSDLFPNYSRQFVEYLNNKNDDPTENSYHIMDIALFSDKYRDNGIFHFKESKG
ncbi:hypothetical protein [Oceanospirillum sediminis]|uniref:Uncharacterized protein n=1 Tax=Oceanospirillum sediminis TaxID=2760088 RepID=A0A839IM69_9GAMM|nr:hypothetical protein [Oceanospirillum sediminis]MBB1485810.1 hypothetical protein [Oceanospirillum sediminis]